MTTLREAIERGLGPDGDLDKELRNVSQMDWQPETADVICEALSRMPLPEQEGKKSPLHALVGLFQDALSEEGIEVARELQERGTPHLVRIFQELRDTDDFSTTNDLMFLLKILAIYRSKEGTKTIVDAAQSGFNADGFMWSVVLGSFDAEHPHSRAVMDEFRQKLPQGFAAVALLDAANNCFIHGDIEQDVHPFDTAGGKRRLEQWLTNDDPDEYSFAHSATAALPFVSNPERDQLLALAMDHADEGVQMEAAWASASLGSEAGLKYLARFCTDRNRSSMACRYLEELGREDVIPEEARDPDFQALAEMCQWLAHPNEFGRPPDDIRQYDSRRLHWPPTDDERWLWLFEYRYDPDEDDEEDEPETGIGMVGSITFALFGETTAGLAPLDAYAIHCCWELEVNEDPRAPDERSVEAGRRLLAEVNEGLKE